MSRPLPSNPSLEHLKKQAKTLLRAVRTGEEDAVARFRSVLPRFKSADDSVIPARVALHEAQLVIAREYGFGHWQDLALHVDPDSARPRPHSRMITPREWSTNQVYTDQESGERATTNEVWKLLTACHDGDVETVSAILDEKPGLVDAEYNYTRPLHFAVREGHADLCRLLIARGASLAYRSYHYKDTLLQMAKDRGFDEIVRLLEARASEGFALSPRADEILSAVRHGDPETVAAMLEEDETFALVSDDTGETALHAACYEGRFDLVRLLVEKGAHVDAERADGCRPIHTALFRRGRGWPAHPSDPVGEDRLAVAGYLLVNGAETNIFLATEMRDREAVERFLAADPSSANFRDASGKRPLTAAAGQRDLDTVRLLLRHGADPSLPERGSPRGLALWIAAWMGQLDMARLLLEHGADPNANVEASGSPLYGAGKNAEMRAILIEYGAEEPLTEFEMAVLEGDLDTVGRILDEDPDVASDPACMFGEGALSHCASDREWDMIKLLVERGVTVPDMSKWGKGYYFKHYDVAKYLLEHGMNPDHMNWHRLTLLHDVAQEGAVDKVTLLLDHGAEIDAIDDEYRSTPLGIAARAGQKPVVELLLARGADPTKGGATWSTPLAWARRYERDDIGAIIEDAIGAVQLP